MPKKPGRPKKESTPVPRLMEPPLLPGFSQSKAGYDQMITHMRKWYRKHPQFEYKMSDFDPEHTVTLLDANGRLMGFFGMWPSVQDASQKNPEHRYVIIDVLEVMDEYKGKGVGRRLVDQIATIARQGGYKFVRTCAISGAEGFYLKCGFKTDKRVNGQNMSIKL